MKEFCQNKNNKVKVATLTSVAALMATTYSNANAADVSVNPQVAGQGATIKEGTVSTNSLRSVVHLTFSKPIKDEFKVSVVPEKNQIIIDVNSADRTFAAPVVENDPLISKISSTLVDNKVRVVVETKQPVKFKIAKQDNKAVLLVEESTEFVNQMTGEKVNPKVAGASSNWTQVNTRQAPSVNTEITTNSAFTEIKRINLKKDGNKNTKLTIDLSNKVDAPTMKKEGGKLIIDFKNVSIPNELQRRVNTENVGTVTQSLDVSMQQSNGRIILEQKENWDYSFYQVENQVVIEVKASDKAEEEKRYVGKKLSISFQDMEVRAILQVIADFTGLNIMSSDKVAGTMTIRLKDVPWDQALDLVLESRGLQKVKDGNVIWVATSDEVKANNDSKLALKNQNDELEALKLEFFQINYYKAEDLKKVLEGKSGTDNDNSKSISVLSKRGTIGLDIRNNILFVQDTEQKLKEVRKLIRKLDIANKQVLVEAKIVIADSSFGRDLGAKFGVKYRKNNGNGALGIGNTLLDSNSKAMNTDTVGVIPAMTSLASQGINSVAPGVIGLTLLNMATGNGLGLELSALEQNNKGKVLSTPRLLTADNKKATIEQGTEVPYVTPGSANSPPTVSFKKAVLKLDVTPQIAPNGKVVLDLNIRKDTIGQLIPIQGGGQIPSIDTKNINTLVTVNNGQTVVLGGVYEISNSDDLSKIPFFGDIPFLGNLFKHTNKSETKGELMIFITPYVIEEADLDDGEKVEISPEITLGKK
jgi:type IV pilus assembly protein PilQ